MSFLLQKIFSNTQIQYIIHKTVLPDLWFVYCINSLTRRMIMFVWARGWIMTVVNVFVSPVILTWGVHVSRFRATWVVFTDTSYVTHSKDKDGWEIGGIFALIFSSSLYYNLWRWGCSQTRTPRACPISPLCDWCIKDCALSPHLNINGADRAPVCPGYLQSPCEGPWPPGVSLNTVVVISGSSGRAGMWEVIQLGDWRHSASTIIIHSKYSRNDIMEICTHWTQAG